MGQYYRIFNITKNCAYTTWDFDEGAKLTEFGYFISKTMQFLCRKLYTSWKGDMVVLVGDYYQGMPLKEIATENPQVVNQLKEEIQKAQREGKDYNLYDYASNRAKKVKVYSPDDKIDVADKAWSQEIQGIQANKDLCASLKEELICSINKVFYSHLVNLGLNFYKRRRYFINYSTNEYVDLYLYFLSRISELKSQVKTMTLLFEHPVALLVACGNSLGLGDYHGLNEEKVGSWAFCKIGITSTLPKDCKQLLINFRKESS